MCVAMFDLRANLSPQTEQTKRFGASFFERLSSPSQSVPLLDDSSMSSLCESGAKRLSAAAAAFASGPTLGLRWQICEDSGGLSSSSSFFTATTVGGKLLTSACSSSSLRQGGLGSWSVGNKSEPHSRDVTRGGNLCGILSFKKINRMSISNALKILPKFTHTKINVVWGPGQHIFTERVLLQ